MKNKFIWTTLALLLSVSAYGQGSGTPSTLQVMTSSEGYLMAAAASQTAPYTTSTFLNTRLRTDASGNLLVAISGTVTPTFPLAAPVACTTIPYSFTGRTTTGLCSSAAATWDLYAGGTLSLQSTTTQVLSNLPLVPVTTNTSTLGSSSLGWLEIWQNKNSLATSIADGLILENKTASTAGVTVQYSPAIRFRSHAWNTTVTAADNTDDWRIYVIPDTGSNITSVLHFKNSKNGAAYTTPMTIGSDGVFTTGSNIVSGGQITSGTNFIAGTGAVFHWTNKSSLQSTTDKTIQFVDNAGTSGLEINMGTPTLGTCTNGSLTTGARSGLFEVTGNTSGSCVVNFGTPNFTNTPLCFVNDETSLTAIRISARSASSITVTGAPSGDAFQVACFGRIGT